MATAPRTVESRRVSRDLVSFRSQARGAAGAAGSVFLVDLSPFGFMARSRMTVRPGDELAVTLPVVGVRHATVRWALGGRLGCEFADPIPAHAYARLLAAAPHDRPGWNEV